MDDDEQEVPAIPVPEAPVERARAMLAATLGPEEQVQLSQATNRLLGLMRLSDWDKLPPTIQLYAVLAAGVGMGKFTADLKLEDLHSIVTMLYHGADIVRTN